MEIPADPDQVLTQRRTALPIPLAISSFIQALGTTKMSATNLTVLNYSSHRIRRTAFNRR
ncbi:hypothetical protein J6590_021466 [Homalodisca vitripennis]|nr:hypothetical protein J6590_021466 [Homalodisca vitripennis]